MRTKALWQLISLSLMTGCLTLEQPVFVDRHTIMEEDASGEWTDLEQKFMEDSLNPGPEPYEQIPESQKKKRVYSILDSDLSRSNTNRVP